MRRSRRRAMSEVVVVMVVMVVVAPILVYRISSPIHFTLRVSVTRDFNMQYNTH